FNCDPPFNLAGPHLVSVDEARMENAQDFVKSIFAWEGNEKESSLPIAKFWEESKVKRTPWLRVQDSKTRKRLDLGPGGAAGIGCGAGIGFGLVGGAGYGAWPWSNLRLAFGIGFGCGIGIGYGFGHGLGILWDRKLPKPPSGKVVIIEI
ncbi:hypothetical protein GOP47_0001053, partial [Adiantum capillus-veneris]